MLCDAACAATSIRELLQAIPCPADAGSTELHARFAGERSEGGRSPLLQGCSASSSSAPWGTLALSDRTGGATTPDACKCGAPRGSRGDGATCALPPLRDGRGWPCWRRRSAEAPCSAGADLALFMSFLQGAGGRPREADGGLSGDVASIAAGHWRRGQPGAHLVGWERPNQAQVHELARSQQPVIPLVRGTAAAGLRLKCSPPKKEIEGWKLVWLGPEQQNWSLD